MQLLDTEAKLAGMQIEQELSFKEVASLKSELNRLRLQQDHTGDSQVGAQILTWYQEVHVLPGGLMREGNLRAS